MKIAIYARVSTRDKQDIDNQRDQLLQFIGLNPGWELAQEYIDHETGSKSDRPQFKSMFQAAAKHKFDVLLVWSLDRFTREGVTATHQYLDRLDHAGVAFRSYTESFLDTIGPFRDVVISMLAVLAKQERLRIAERVKAGVERARKRGVRLGRKPVDLPPPAKLRELHRHHSIREIAGMFRCGRNTILRRLKEEAAA